MCQQHPTVPNELHLLFVPPMLYRTQKGSLAVISVHEGVRKT
jgi:hypothetical protein